ncbi:MAG: hypothetical protein Q4G23_00850 [Clostridia bacterium]|nr:hypothetical protein [Clostridia bacterium]
MKKRFLYLLLPIITLILEILPYGAVCNFMRPPASANSDAPVGHFRELFSYFDLTPFGYANFAPMITAVMTCIILLILAIYCFTGKESLVRTARNILCVCSVISFGPLALGPDFLSVVGVLISISLVAEFIVLLSFNKTLKR